jgi:1,4-alpha-glucan branching enzyme
MNFYCSAPTATQVSLVGDFNHWDASAHPLKKAPDGVWFLSVEMHHGHQRYAFMVDGQLRLDDKAQGITRNDQGERVCLISVSGF